MIIPHGKPFRTQVSKITSDNYASGNSFDDKFCFPNSPFTKKIAVPQGQYAPWLSKFSPTIFLAGSHEDELRAMGQWGQWLHNAAFCLVPQCSNVACCCGTAIALARCTVEPQLAVDAQCQKPLTRTKNPLPNRSALPFHLESRSSNGGENGFPHKIAQFCTICTIFAQF